MTQKPHTTRTLVAGLAVAAIACLAASAPAEETSPKAAPAAAKAESKQAESAKAAASGLTKEAVVGAVESHIKGKTDKATGAYTFHNAKKNKDVPLKLDRVRKDALAKTADGKHFVCAEFTTTNGKHTYDLDFLVTGADAKALSVGESMIHKKDGVPKYQWKEKDGTWTKVDVVKKKKDKAGKKAKVEKKEAGEE